MLGKRNLILTAMIGLALAAVPGLATGSHSEGKGPKLDFVHGTGHFEGPFPPNPTLQLDITMHFNAKSGPSGEDAKGRFFVKRSDPTPLYTRGEVTCLNVVGNTATVGGRVEQTGQPTQSPVGSGVLFQVVDNGQGEQSVVDRMHGDSLPQPPESCPAPTAVTRLDVERGNFGVHDAQP